MSRTGPARGHITTLKLFFVDLVAAGVAVGGAASAPLGLRGRDGLESALDLAEVLGVLQGSIQQLVVDCGTGRCDGLLDGRQRGTTALIERDDGRGCQLGVSRPTLLFCGRHVVDKVM